MCHCHAGYAIRSWRGLVAAAGHQAFRGAHCISSSCTYARRYASLLHAQQHRCKPPDSAGLAPVRSCSSTHAVQEYSFTSNQCQRGRCPRPARGAPACERHMRSALSKGQNLEPDMGSLAETPVRAGACPQPGGAAGGLELQASGSQPFCSGVSMDTSTFRGVAGRPMP